MSARTVLIYSLGAAGPALAATTEDEDPLAWQDAGRCAEVDPEIFFPDKGESSLPAKRVCQGCEVRAECLEYALANGERFGVWGGLSERERRRLRARFGDDIATAVASAVPAVTDEDVA